MKNILVIQGGGRPKGNTAQLIDSFVKGAAESGHKADIRLVNTCRSALAVMPAAMGNHVFKRTALMIWCLK